MSPETLRYEAPPGVELVQEGGPFLTTPEGGRVRVDGGLASLWHAAKGRTLADIERSFHLPGCGRDAVRAGLACLAEAGLLERGHAGSAPERREAGGPLVSVVILGFNGAEWLAGCIASLREQTYRPLEIIVVDNASVDGTAGWVEEHCPDIRLVRLCSSVSIAAAYNSGAAVTTGKYLLLLNQDTTLDPDAIAEMMRVARSNPACAAVAPKLKLMWAPAFLNGLGNRVDARSWGTDNGIGHLDLGQFDHWREVPSACGAAMLIPAKAWREVGEMDPDFPMYYEDVEWSYRARLSGLRILAAPRAIVLHAFGGRTPDGSAERLPPRKLGNAVFGRWRFTLKLLADSRPTYARNYLREDRRGAWEALRHGRTAEVLAYAGAWAGILRQRPALRRANAAVQKKRRIPDRELFEMQRSYPGPLVHNGVPLLSMEVVRDHYLPVIRGRYGRDLAEMSEPGERRQLLIVSNDVVDRNMGGPGARYLEMARALAEDVDVTLAVPADTTLEPEGFEIVRYHEDRPESLEVLVENSDVALISGYMSVKFRFLEETRTSLVVDLYDPFFLENLFYYFDKPLHEQEHLNLVAIDVANRLNHIGDFFICGSERQRDFFLGMLTASARINPRTFMEDARLRRLIDVVGIGLPAREPVAGAVLRGVHPAVPRDAKIVLWGGGIWNWLDPLTLIRAWPTVLAKVPKARLVFLGARYPNPAVPAHDTAVQALALAREIGENDRSIVFVDWLPYEDYERALCEADVGVTLQPDTLETHLAARSRIVNYFWVRLPVLASEGDVTAEWVREHGVGRIVPIGDTVAVAEGLVELLAVPKDSFADSFRALRRELSWPEVVAPLRRYLVHCSYAVDRWQRARPQSAAAAGEPPLAVRVRRVWREEGLRGVVRRTARRVVGS